MSSSGIFISFEGIDGAGKSTHIDALARAFEGQGRVVTLTREPGGTGLAEKLRALILHEPMDAMTSALLVFAARRDHLQNRIEPALARGEVVLCDRFTDSTFAYQGGGQGFDREMLLFLEQKVQSNRELEPNLIREPDLTLWFDLPPEVAAGRLSTARAPDQFEALDAAFFGRVAAAYAERAQQFPARFERIDAALEVSEVWQQVWQAVAAKGWLAPRAGERRA